MGQRAKALILAGGLGTRLRPLTDVIPKCLVPIGGRTLLDYWVECLVEAGISEARINTHAHAGRVRDHIKSVNSAGRLRLSESYEPELLGSAGTVAANADLADGADEIVIIYADNLSDIDLRPLLAFHRQHGDPLTMVLFRAPNPAPAGSPNWTERAGSSHSSRNQSGRPATWPTPGSMSSMPPLTAKLPRWKRSTWASMCSPNSWAE